MPPIFIFPRSRAKPELLDDDEHTTHTKNLEVIDKAREKCVVLLCFPPHTTHRLQPLDVSLMAALSIYYSSEVQRWMQLHPGRPLNIAQIGKLFETAYMKAASVQTTVNGFRKTGIHLLNPDKLLTGPQMHTIKIRKITSHCHKC